MGNGSKLLINEHPLQVLPTLATLVGLNEAIFLQQLHYWMENPKVGKEYEGRKYVRNSFEEWQETNFPFWSLPTLKRIVTSLKSKNLIRSTARLNKMPIDRTQWYTINYAVLDSLMSDDSDMATRKYQNDTMAKCQSDTIAEYQNDTTIVSKRYDTKYQSDTTYQRLPETTTETNNEGGNTPPSGSHNSTPKPLAVHAYRKIAHLYPDKALWQTLDEAIGDKPENLEFWEQVVTDWIGCGWRKTNLKGMLDHYKRRELPTTGGEANGHKSGKSASTTNGAVGRKQKGQGGIPALEARSRYEKRANIKTGETYWLDSETGERCDPPPGLS
jgi:hypothetical protein